MVHSNAVESQEAMEGADGFDASKSVGMIGDGSGTTGFYVMPMASSPSDSTTVPFGQTQTYEALMATTDMSNPAAVNAARSNLEQFINISNPVNKDLGACATQYASEYFDATIRRDGFKYTLHFEKGEIVGKLNKGKQKNRHSLNRSNP